MSPPAPPTAATPHLPPAATRRRRNSIGVDTSDKKSRVCVLSFEGEVLEETEIATSVSGYTRYYDVIVANPHKLALISESNHKTDRRDAQTLAKLAALSPELLSPVTQRSPEMRLDVTVMHARDALVNERTALVNTVRGLVKPLGDRIPGTISTHAFHTKALEHIPPKLVAVLTPLLTVIGELTKQIDHYEREVEKLGKEKYPVTEYLREVAGVGPITSLAFVLCIMDPRRFKKSRDVGPYLGLVPRTYQSGESSPELRITKSGNTLVRRLLVGSAHYILGPFGHNQDSDLRRYGLALMARGGKAAKKRAVVAVARKLAVILHHMWLTGEVYDPLRNTKRRESKRTSS